MLIACKLWSSKIDFPECLRQTWTDRQTESTDDRRHIIAMCLYYTGNGWGDFIFWRALWTYHTNSLSYWHVGNATLVASSSSSSSSSSSWWPLAEDVVRSVLIILHNVVTKTESAAEALRQAQTVDVLQQLRYVTICEVNFTVLVSWITTTTTTTVTLLLLLILRRRRRQQLSECMVAYVTGITGIVSVNTASELLIIYSWSIWFYTFITILRTRHTH